MFKYNTYDKQILRTQNIELGISHTQDTYFEVLNISKIFTGTMECKNTFQTVPVKLQKQCLHTVTEV